MHSLPDEKARNKALDIRHSFHLEAPAGSGKTWLLTGRFLGLLAEVDHPHEILALTFTNKAAGEMRERIRNLLNRAVAGDTPRYPQEEPLLQAAMRASQRQPAHRLAAPDGLRIMTFHGFCLYLVQRAPIEASVTPGARVMSDEEQQQLRTQVAAATIHGLLQRPRRDLLRHAVENRLLRLNNNWFALRDQLADLIERRDLLQDLLTLMGSHPDRQQLEMVLTERLERLLQVLMARCSFSFESTFLGENWPDFIAHLHKNGAAAGNRLPGSLPPAEATELEKWQEIASVLTTTEGKPRKQVGPKTGFYSGFSKSKWAEAILKLPAETLHLLQDLKTLPSVSEGTADLDALYDLVLVVGEALHLYRSACRQRHLLDYVELEQAALRLFDQATPTDLQLFLDRKIQHLLVDEFQDTSRSQWLLLQHLCSGWLPDSDRTLFVVGDPKQSIYAFRKAEVSLFLEAKKGLPIPGQDRFSLRCLQLEANFRSNHRLVDWNNELFGRTIMNRAADEFDEVPYVDATAVVEPIPDQLSLNLFSSEDQGVDPREIEAEWLGKAVRRELKRLTEGETIGILLFARTHLSHYLQGLQRAGVAVQVQEGTPILAHREVLHLRQIAHALVRPQDDLAWAALLRAPWCELTLEQFVEVAKRPEPSWLEKIRAAKTDFPLVAELWEAITRGRQRVGRDELATLVENLWLQLGGPEVLASNGSSAGVANCRRFLDLLARAEQGIPEETLVKAELLLQHAYAPPDPRAAPSPVELMTVHRAKGLEFDVLFLPFLDWNPLSGGRGSHPPYLLERLPDSSGELLIAMAPDRRRDNSVSLYQLLRRFGERKQLAEAKRIFYVAATRARRSLYLSGIVRTKNGEISSRKESPLGWLDKHYGLKQSENGELVAENNSFLDLNLNPVLTSVDPDEHAKATDLPEPLAFEPEPLPYITVAPSQLTDRVELTQKEEDDPYARARGAVTHRLLEYLGKKDSMPHTPAVVAALVSEGVLETEAQELAEEILQEIQDCLQEEFFNWLLSKGHPQAYCEWSLEDRPAEGQIRTGIVDRVVFDGDDWWVVDYKTSRPPAGEKAEDFLKREVAIYRPQLLAYREMVANYRKVDINSVRLVLYFTALQRKLELNSIS